MANSRTGCGQHEFWESDWTRLRSRTGQDYGQLAGLLGRVPATSDHALEIAWTICRMLHVCQADCYADLSGNGRMLPGCCSNRCANISRQFAWTLCGCCSANAGIIDGILRGRFAGLTPHVAQTAARTFAGCCVRCCPDYSWTVARLMRRMPRCMLRGYCVNRCLTFM